MSKSFADLKRNSNASLEKLNQELTKLNTNNQQSTNDDRYWSYQRDKAGNASAVIRFLPAAPGEDVPFVRLYTHGFKGPGGWYIENSRTTLGQNEKDPVSVMNGELWAQGEGSAGRKRVSGSGKENPGTKRQTSYISNIYIVSDPANPENNGKVMLFKYGKKIFDKLNDAMNPTFEEDAPVNPFDLWEGANFKLRVRQVEGYPNYDKSEFETAGPLLDDDSALEAVWNSQFSLNDIIDPKNFKPYEVLESRMNKVVGNDKPIHQEEKTKAQDPEPLKEVEPKSKAVEEDNDIDLDDFFSSIED